jgi:hypothetical protein
MTAALIFFPASSLLLAARADGRTPLLPRHLGVKQEVRPASSPLLLLFLLQLLASFSDGWIVAI